MVKVYVDEAAAVLLDYIFHDRQQLIVSEGVHRFVILHPHQGPFTQKRR